MIGGYFFQSPEHEIEQRLNTLLKADYQRVSCGAAGFLFYDEPYADVPTACYASDQLTLLSQDLLVTGTPDGGYAALDLRSDLPALFARKQMDMLSDIVSDYRMVVVDRRTDDPALYLVSHRAGNGRMYYTTTAAGLLFASDIRFLLRIVPLDVNEAALYAILKYGGVPEPLTISKAISAVPPAHYLRYQINRRTSEMRVYFQFEFPCDAQPGPVEDFDAPLQPVKKALRHSAQFLRPQNPAILISGGIDSSLYASYLHEFDGGERLHGLNCTFGDHDSELPFAQALADKINARFHIGKMQQEDALALLQDTVALSGHPFSDFSSLPIVFILKFMREHLSDVPMLIEGNGADDCFGFGDLGNQSKMQMKGLIPQVSKDLLVSLFKGMPHWKWRSHEGPFARLLALADNHESNPLNYFLALAPANFLGLNADSHRNREVTAIMDGVFSRCGKDYDGMRYEAKTTIRQLLHINSRRWAAKAFSVGESLGIRIVYPYIWRDILALQGAVPWSAKIHEGVVKWPLKRLLEEFMPKEFIYRPKSGFVPPFVQWLTNRQFNQMVRDNLLASSGVVQRIVEPHLLDELLTDALEGKLLRFPVLNFLWGALFTEMWIQNYQKIGTRITERV
jgi:asparagine synthase (glutamine-hydrolysing)